MRRKTKYKLENELPHYSTYYDKNYTKSKCDFVTQQYTIFSQYKMMTRYVSGSNYLSIARAPVLNPSFSWKINYNSRLTSHNKSENPRKRGPHSLSLKQAERIFAVGVNRERRKKYLRYYSVTTIFIRVARRNDFREVGWYMEADRQKKRHWRCIKCAGAEHLNFKWPSDRQIPLCVFARIHVCVTWTGVG